MLNETQKNESNLAVLIFSILMIFVVFFTSVVNHYAKNAAILNLFPTLVWIGQVRFIYKRNYKDLLILNEIMLLFSGLGFLIIIYYFVDSKQNILPISFDSYSLIYASIMPFIYYAMLRFAKNRLNNPLVINQSESINSKLRSSKKMSLIILCFVGLIISLYIGSSLINNQISYDLYYSCKSEDVNCKESNVIVTFDVNKEMSQVILIAKITDLNKTNLKKLENCIVVDKHNWECTDKAYNSNYGYGSWTVDEPHIYTMIDDNLTMSDNVYTTSTNNKVTRKTYYGYSFVRRLF